MNKKKSFAKSIPLKIYLFLSAVLVLLFFSNDFGLVDIQKTAIILAAGVDRAENEFVLTAQIAVPEGNGNAEGGSATVEIEGRGETVSDCVRQIYCKTGKVPKFVFCDLILLGEDAAKEDVFSCLDFFLRSESMPDSSLIAVCEGTAKEMLSTSSAVDDASSLALEKLFSDAAKNAGTVTKTTLREFAIGYYGTERSGATAYVRAIDQTENRAGDQSKDQAADKESEEKKIYSAGKSALFSEGKMVALLTEEETFAYALLENNVSTGSFTAEENGTPVSFTLFRGRGKVRLNAKSAPELSVRLNVTLRVNNRGNSSSVRDAAEGQLSEKELAAAEEVLGSAVRSLWEKSAASGCDLFRLRRTLYRTAPGKYAEWKDTLLASLTPQITVHAVSVK